MHWPSCRLLLHLESCPCTLPRAVRCGPTHRPHLPRFCKQSTADKQSMPVRASSTLFSHRTCAHPFDSKQCAPNVPTANRWSLRTLHYCPSET